MTFLLLPVLRNKSIGDSWTESDLEISKLRKIGRPCNGFYTTTILASLKKGTET
jgi:hypothetical protein